MNIYYLGHSSFLIKTETGKRILTDPFQIDSSLENVDIITVSHPHFDHSDTKNFPDKSKILQSQTTLETSFCKIQTLNSYHDESFGSKRGPNLIFNFKINDITLCHLGDLGHQLDADSLNLLKNIDVIFVPVGENYTVDLKSLHRMLDIIKPKYIIPMHYRTETYNFSLNSLDKFLLIFKNYKKEKLDTLSISKDTLTEENNKIILLEKIKVEI